MCAIHYRCRANCPKDLTIVSPDVGGVVRARAMAKKLDAGLAIIDKRREKAGESEVMNIIGDVDGRECIMLDDIVDSAGTLCNAAVALKEAGAKTVTAYVSHGVLSGDAVDRVNKSPLGKVDRHGFHRGDSRNCCFPKDQADQHRAFNGRSDYPH